MIGTLSLPKDEYETEIEQVTCTISSNNKVIFVKGDNSLSMSIDKDIENSSIAEDKTNNTSIVTGNIINSNKYDA